jgi:hypothetical protein
MVISFKPKQDMAFSLILGRPDLRGFCLFIFYIIIRISAKKSAQMPYPAFSIV